MKRLAAFLKATLLGGLLLVLPAWLAVLLVMKALMQVQIFVQPIATELPQSVGYPRVIAGLLLIGLCFLVGLAIQTAIGTRVKRMAEENLLNKLPGYSTLRGFATQLAQFETTTTFQSALIEIEDALVPGFFVEEHSGDRCTVFIPSVPTPMAGAVYIIAMSRVHRLNLPAIAVMQCISKWGAGSNELVAALDGAKRSAVKAAGSS